MAGRLAVGALDLLLSHQRLILVPEGVRLPALLRKSRDYQAHVSTELAGQVLEALYELGRGFQAADEKEGGTLLGPVLDRDPQELYGGLISTLLRLVFLLYAEDRGLMPAGPLYQRNYSVAGLFEQLRTDHEHYPDTMDHRFGSWPRLLALFRAVHGGSRHPAMVLPARQGHLFDFDRFPFLEGRNQPDAPLPEQLPRLSDGTLHRVLHLLLNLKGERLSYRTLDVEQIGSVYETVMGFEVQKATGRSIALKPKKSHGAPIHLSLDDLLAAKPADRLKLLAEQGETKLAPAAAKTVKEAATLDDLLAALDKRIDRRATPHPVPAGSLILQPTDERRRSGSHYTPRSFTQPIVRKTLEPILDRLGRHPRPEVILDLKVADIAVGSAAFLVETCRQLADELTASWHFHKCLPVLPPDEDELLYARRLVAQRCLYGVDRNPMAVDLAKLSLWLATMAKDHPFTFVDHSIKCGDSLVGLTNRQIADFHWLDRDRLKQELAEAVAANKEKKELNRIKAALAILEKPVIGQEKLEQQIAKVASERKRILDLREDSEAAVLNKRGFLAAADSAAASLKTTGDLVIAAFFASAKPKERQQLRDEFLHRHLELQKGDAQQLPWEVETLRRLRSGEHQIRPFHWEIEFPEVFSRKNGGFDAIVGNPPFAGRSTLSQAADPAYIPWLLQLHPTTHGNGDLVAHFFRRSHWAVRNEGTYGLIATNTIGQGDTRQGGLCWICEHSGEIYSAIRRIRWPGEAAVVVSVVHISKGLSATKKLINGKAVEYITAFLFPSGGNTTPPKLACNSRIAFQGSVVVGIGFTFDDNDNTGLASPILGVKRLAEIDPRNSERIFPYIGGEEMNDSPTQSPSRYIIDFGDMSLKEAAKWPDLLAIVESKVKQEREEKLAKSWSKDKEKRARTWWQFARTAKDLYRAINSLERVLALSQTSKYFSLTFLPRGYVYSNKLVIFARESFASFATLQSLVHTEWAEFMGSTMKDDPVYTPTDCFETFPFPADWESNAALEAAGREYYAYRAALMVRNNEGLTKTYNRFHDPEERSRDILELRRLHAAMDRAVLDAYGWPDVSTDCEFLLDYEDDDEGESETTGTKRNKKKPWRYRWPDDVRDDVLARLLALNAVRAEQERLSGASKATAKKAAAKKPATENVAEKLSPDELGLFGPQDNTWENAIERLVVGMPTGKREPAPSSLAYYRILIPAMIQEAGGSLPLDLLFTAASSLEDQDTLLESNEELAATAKKRWKQQFRENVDAASFGSALKSLAADGKRVRIVGSPDNLEVRNLLGERIVIDWIITDARLSLKAALKLASQGKETDVPADVSEELSRHVQTA